MAGKNRTNLSASIRNRVTFPVLLVVILQTLLSIAVLAGGGVFAKLEENACSILDAQVSSRRNELFSSMTESWAQMDPAVTGIHEYYEDYLAAHQLTDAQFAADRDTTKDFLTGVAPDLVLLLRHNGVNGAFLIMAGNDEYFSPQGTEHHTKLGVSIRDMDQDAGYKDDEDILLERAPIVVGNTLGYALDSWWESTYTFTADRDNSYFYKPLEAAQSIPGANYRNLGYWCPPHSVSGSDPEVLSYSVPLMSKDGTVYAVLGLEILATYVRSRLPNSDLGEKSVYVLAQSTAGGYRTLLYSGYYYNQRYDSNSVIVPGDLYYNDCYTLAETENRVLANIQPLVLYGNHSPFEGDQFVLIGMRDRDEMLGFVQNVQNFYLAAMLLSLTLGLLGCIVATKVVTAPILQVSRQVRSCRREDTLQLKPIGISEIDQLIDSITDLNQSVICNQAKLSTIIGLLNFQVGAFEVNCSSGTVFLSDGFFQVLRGVYSAQEQEQMRSKKLFLNLSTRITACCTETIHNDKCVTRICNITPLVGENRWISVRQVETDTAIVGVLLDVTTEYMEKRKIEYERDHDTLTGLLNRRAFESKVTELFQTPQTLGVAAMVMLDIDNLKFINDTYGHGTGDRYIGHAADVLRVAEVEKSVLARISGDEFTLFLYGGNSEDELAALIQRIQQKMADTVMDLHGGASAPVSLSGGVSWYPRDSTDLKELRRYADFAMYQIKKNQKGQICFFDATTYPQQP